MLSDTPDPASCTHTAPVSRTHGRIFTQEQHAPHARATPLNPAGMSVSQSVSKSVNQSVNYTYSSHLWLIRCLLTLIVRVSTQDYIQLFSKKLGDIHKIILPKLVYHVQAAPLLKCCSGAGEGPKHGSSSIRTRLALSLSLGAPQTAAHRRSRAERIWWQSRLSVLAGPQTPTARTPSEYDPVACTACDLLYRRHAAACAFPSHEEEEDRKSVCIVMAEQLSGFTS